MTSRKDPKTGEPLRPAKNTLHQEIVCLRQVLNGANRYGGFPTSPHFSAPFRRRAKSHTAGGSPWRNTTSFDAPRRNGRKDPPKPRWRRSCEQLHDYVLFMANTGLRPDEPARLQFRDGTIVEDDVHQQETFLKSRCAVSAAPATAKVCRALWLPSSDFAARSRSATPDDEKEGEVQPGRSETWAQELSMPKPPDFIFDRDASRAVQDSPCRRGLSRSIAKASAARPTAFATPTSVCA